MFVWIKNLWIFIEETLLEWVFLGFVLFIVFPGIVHFANTTKNFSEFLSVVLRNIGGNYSVYALIFACLLLWANYRGKKYRSEQEDKQMLKEIHSEIKHWKRAGGNG